MRMKFSICAWSLARIEQVDVLLLQQPERQQRDIGGIEHIAGHHAVRGHQRIDVDALHPARQQIVGRLEVDRRDHRDEIAHALGMERARSTG